MHRMSTHSPHRPAHPDRKERDDFDSTDLPVEPDFGPVPALIPDDPEHDRTVDPTLETL